MSKNVPFILYSSASHRPKESRNFVMMKYFCQDVKSNIDSFYVKGFDSRFLTYILENGMILFYLNKSGM